MNNEKSWDWFFLFALIMIGLCGMIGECDREAHASGNVMVYGNLPPWEITSAKFDAVNGQAGVRITENNPEEVIQWKSREGWVFTTTTTRIGFHEVFNLLYDAESGLIYFKLGTTITPCAIKKTLPILPNHVYNLDMGCKLEVEKNMVWLELND